jgi:hypothetical protein
MMDLPQEPAIVHECIVEVKASSQQHLEITDLSFYNVLAGGMCSGSSSSGPGDIIQTSASIEEEVS